MALLAPYSFPFVTPHPTPSGDTIPIHSLVANGCCSSTSKLWPCCSCCFYSGGRPDTGTCVAGTGTAQEQD